MNKDRLLDKVLNGEGMIFKCPKCNDVVALFDKEVLVCLNEECDYQLRVLEGGNNK
ncbi:hypothetical protein BC7_00002 [Bacillus phage BC-7]|nr:hypothetical protein BC7_00002 [Bacillus phage BC-7]